MLLILLGRADISQFNKNATLRPNIVQLFNDLIVRVHLIVATSDVVTLAGGGAYAVEHGGAAGESFAVQRVGCRLRSDSQLHLRRARWCLLLCCSWLSRSNVLCSA